MLVVFFTDYKEKKTGIIINDFGRIAKHYLLTYFLVDFLSIIPFFEILKMYNSEAMDLKKGDTYNYYHLLFLIRLFRVYKVFKLIDPVNFLKMLK